jgi:hypothetical protein
MPSLDIVRRIDNIGLVTKRHLLTGDYIDSRIPNLNQSGAVTCQSIATKAESETVTRSAQNRCPCDEQRRPGSIQLTSGVTRCVRGLYGHDMPQGSGLDVQ